MEGPTEPEQAAVSVAAMLLLKLHGTGSSELRMGPVQDCL